MKKISKPKIVKTQSVVKKVVLPVENVPFSFASVYPIALKAAVILFTIIALFYVRGLGVAVVINGAPISRLSIVSQLEKKYGKQIIEKVVTEELIKQELNKQKLGVTDEKIAKEYATLEKNIGKQGKDLNQLLAAQGMTKEDLSAQIKTQLQVEALFKKQTSVTQKEIDSFIEKNKESIPADLSKEELQKQSKDQLVRAKLDPLFQKWTEQLKKKAKVEYYVQY